MFVSRIDVRNFRNHIRVSHDLAPCTYITGANGTGKTSLVEAIYLAFTLRSFRRQVPKELIRFGEDHFRIGLTLLSQEREHTLLYFQSDKRTLHFDGSPVTSAEEHLFSHPVLCYSPDNEHVGTGSQESRRRQLDRLIFYRQRGYYSLLKEYTRLLHQRGAELKKTAPDRIYLETLHDMMQPLATAISDARARTVETINRHLALLYPSCSFPVQELFLSYSSNITAPLPIERELREKTAVWGVQRDKILLVKDGSSFEKFPSYGQKKTFQLLTLKAFLIAVEEMGKTDIIVALDDFEAGLDRSRSEYLFQLFKSCPQVLFTGVEKSPAFEAATIHL